MVYFVWFLLIFTASCWFLSVLVQGFMSSSFFKKRRPQRLISDYVSVRFPWMMKLSAWCQQEMRDAYEHASKNGDVGRFASGMGFLKMFWIFVITSFFGSAMETVWCILDRGHFEMRTSVAYGFIIPIYGFGAVAMSAGLYRFYKIKAFWLFLGGAFIGSGVEYLASVIQEVFYHTRSWDYNNMPFSFQGRTSLMFAFLWGVMSVVWVKLILPLLSKFIERIPRKAGILFTVLLAVYLAVQMVLTTSALYRQIERRKEAPPSNLFEKYLDRTLPDEYLEWIFPNMVYIE